MQYEFARRGLSAPVNVTWEVTYACNGSCMHCLSAHGERHPLELTCDQCFSVIDDLADMHVFQFNIGGGEPFLRPDFLDIMDYAHGKGIVTCISTNGTFIDRSIAERLKKDLVFLQVSLDGATPRSNDRIRGEGTYEKTLKGLETLRGNGIRLSINTVLTRVNFDELEMLYDLANQYEVTLRVSRLRPSGRAKANWPDLHLSKKQLLEFSDWLSEHRDISTGDSFFSISREDRRSLGLNMCGAGTMTCCISPIGEIYPCAFLQEKVFCAGKVPKDSFAEIWHQSAIFRAFRNLEIEACKKCSRFDYCHGGCPAVAYHTQKALGYPDPECLANLVSDGMNPRSSLG